MRVTGLVLIRSGVNLLIFGTILAVLSYVRTENFRKRTGVNPWGIPPLVWAIASFFVIVLGTLLSIIACATTKVPTRTSRWMGAAGHPGAPGQVYPPSGGNAPGYGPVPPGTPSSPVDAPLPPFRPTTAVAATSPPRWFADPTGRHEYRYWDGSGPSTCPITAPARSTRYRGADDPHETGGDTPPTARPRTRPHARPRAQP